MKRAAADLGVSQSAVSHQIRELGDVVGQQLVLRSGRGIALTPVGERLAAKLGQAFAGLESIVKELSNDGQELVQLAVCSSSGPGWLIEKLGSFKAQHPALELQLRLYAQDPLLANEVADAYVTAGPQRPGYASIRLREEMLVAVMQSGAPAEGPQALITTELEAGTLGADWVRFCRKAGLKLSALQRGAFRQCTHYLLAMEMASAGQGVALVPDFLAARDLAAGRLSLFSQVSMPSNRTYRLCYRASRAHEAKIAALVEWFRSEIADPEQPVKQPVRRRA